MKKINSQSGNAHIVIIVILVIALVSTLGFVFWQNFMQDKDDSAKTSKQTSQNATILPDMIEYPTTVLVKSDAETAQLTNAPASFKDFVVQTIKADNIAISAENSKCVRVIGVDKIYKQSYTLGSVGATGLSGNEDGCLGGAVILWGIVSGSWIQIGMTQDIGFLCEELEKYKVPSAIAGTTCFDGSENGRAYSQS